MSENTQIHGDLDAAVLEAYGWSSTLSNEEILERLVALNTEHACKEAAGHIRCLRPEFQAPKGAAGTEQRIAEFVTKPKAPKKDAVTKKTADRAPWPASLKEQVQAVRAALAGVGSPVTADELVAGLKGGAAKESPRGVGGDGRDGVGTGGG